MYGKKEGTVAELIERLKAHYPDTENTYILAHIWGEEDVQIIAEDEFDTTLTKDEIGGVLGDIDRHIDCEYGVNWESIRVGVENTINEREEN